MSYHIDMAQIGTNSKSSNFTRLTEKTSRKKAVFLIVGLMLLAVAGYFIWKALSGVMGANRLEVSGRLEGYETNLSPKIGGRIDFIKYREGDPVKTDELVAQLSDDDYQAQLRSAEAKILRAQQSVLQDMNQLALVHAQIYGASKRLAQAHEETNAQINQGKAGLSEAQERYRQARADLAQAQSELELASIRLTRYTNLVKKGAVTKDEYDQARTTYGDAVATVKSREANQQAAFKAEQSAQAVLAQNVATRFTPPIRRSDLKVSNVQLAQAENQLQAAKDEVAGAKADRDQILANLNYLAIRSPIYGVVTARPVEPGAVLTPGQTILTVLDYSKVYMRAYVPEGGIGAVRVGQAAKVFLDAMPGKPFTGRVIEIDPEASFTPENIYFKDDRVKQVFGIKISIDEPGGYAKPGMPADAVIDL